MHVADYFYTLVHNGESVFVVGTPKKAGSSYVGPVRNSPVPPVASTTLPGTPVAPGGEPIGPPRTPPPTHTPTTHRATTTMPKPTTTTAPSGR
jgi:hypothetical protein